MNNYMNKPVEYKWVAEDIVTEYKKCKDKKKVAKIWNLSAAEVNELLNDKNKKSQ